MPEIRQVLNELSEESGWMEESVLVTRTRMNGILGGIVGQLLAEQTQVFIIRGPDGSPGPGVPRSHRIIHVSKRLHVRTPKIHHAPKFVT